MNVYSEPPPVCPSSGTSVPLPWQPPVPGEGGIIDASIRCVFCRREVLITHDGRFIAHPYVEPPPESYGTEPERRFVATRKGAVWWGGTREEALRRGLDRCDDTRNDGSYSGDVAICELVVLEMLTPADAMRRT